MRYTVNYCRAPVSKDFDQLIEKIEMEKYK